MRACNDTEVIRTENLINGIFITRQRCGALGNWLRPNQSLISLRFPVIDDNVDVIGEFAEKSRPYLPYQVAKEAKSGESRDCKAIPGTVHRSCGAIF